MRKVPSIAVLAIAMIVSMALPAVPAASAKGGHAHNRPLIGLVGVETPAGSAADFKRVDAASLRHYDLSGLDGLIVDASVFHAAKSDRAIADALSSFSDRKPVTFVGVSPAEVGLTNGADVTSGGVRTEATSTVRAGGVTFSLDSTWSSTATSAEIANATMAWWQRLQERFPAVFSQAYIPGGWYLVYSTSYQYTVSPYGTISYSSDWYRSSSETDPSHDYWVVLWQTSTNPGTNMWGNSWFTSRTWIYSNVNYYSYDPYLYSSQPGSTCCSDYIGYSIGVQGSYISNSYYVGSNVNAIQESSAQQYNSIFEVEHDMSTWSWPAYSSFTSQPASEFQVGEGNCLQIPFINEAEWKDYNSGNLQYTWINSWRQVCP
ncbi:MAG: hypothetical protein ACYDDF_01020 [Thermoplasmatota archaeon]